jgi:hypothetical protein
MTKARYYRCLRTALIFVLGTVLGISFWATVKKQIVNQVEQSSSISAQKENRGQEQEESFWEAFAVRTISDPVTLYTLVLTLFTGMLWRSTEKLWKAGERQRKVSQDAIAVAIDANQITRKIGEAQIRAYLTCIGGTYKIDNFTVTCWPTIANNGQSPATNVRMAGILVVPLDTRKVGEPIPDINFLRTEKWEAGAPMIPSQGQESSLLIFMHTQIGKTRFEALRLWNTQFHVECRIYWEDVFGKQQSTPIILRQIPPYTFTQGTDMDREGELSAYNQGHERG